MRVAAVLDLELVQSVHNAVEMSISSLETRYALIVISLYFFSVFLWGLRWAIASRIEIRPASLAYVLEGIFVGILVNNLINIYSVSGELARIAWTSYRSGIETAKLATGVAVERVSELPVALVYTLLFVKAFQTHLAVSLYVVGVVRRACDYVYDTLQKAYEVLLNPKLVLTLCALSAALWIVDSVRLFFLAKFVGVSIDMSIAASLTLLGVASRLISLTPGNIGVFEGTYILFLNVAGYNSDDVLALVLAERATASIIPSLLGALFVFKEGGFTILKKVVTTSRAD